MEKAMTLQGMINSSLSDMVSAYADVKAREKEVKKDVDELNKDIKAAMIEGNISEAHGGGYVATLTEQKREDFDEDKLITLFKKNLDTNPELAKCIKTKEYIDMEALENLIYNAEVDNNIVTEMGKCKVEKVTQVLRIKKDTKKKGDK